MFWKAKRAPTEFSLQHPCGLHVHRELRESESVKSAAAEVWDMGTGYMWYRLPVARFAEREIGMALCFHIGALDSISLGDADPRYGTGWNDWDEQKEKARAAATGQWLAAIGYRVGCYPWGTVWVGIDPKTGDGGGGVRFGWWPAKS